MSSPMNVLNAFYKQNYDEVIELIKKNKSLLNSTGDLGDPLFQLVLAGSKKSDERQKLLEFMVTHPEFNFAHKPFEGKSNIHLLIGAARIDLLKLIIKDPHSINPEVLCSQGKLSYQTAKELLETKKKLLAKAENLHVNPESIQRDKEKINNLLEIISLLRDATILQAIATDDVELLQKLEQAGDDPTNKMGDFGANRYLNMCVTKSNIKIRTWLHEQSEASLINLTENPNSFYAKSQKVNELEAQKEKLKQDYLKNKSTLINKGLNMEVRHWDELYTFTSTL